MKESPFNDPDSEIRRIRENYKNDATKNIYYDVILQNNKTKLA
jgi:hypothetical protein